MKKWIKKTFFWWLLTVATVFLPLLFLLGFGVSDDLSFVGNIAPDFLNDLSYSLSRPGHISRPLYGLIQTSTLHLFRENHLWYNMLRLGIWLLIIYQSNKVFRSFFINESKWLFIFFVSFPVFTSAHLFNFFQMGYLLSLLFFLLALGAIKDDSGGFTQKRHIRYLIYGLLAMFSCEIVFPLFVFPILYNHWSKLSGIFRSKLFYLTAFIFLIFFAFKFLIGPLYQSEASVYGFNPSLNSMLQSMYYFVVILLEVPLMLIEVIPFFISEVTIWFSLLAIPLFYAVNRRNDFEYNRKFFYVVILTLSFCSLIFFASNYPAVSFGLYNKMLLPSHLLYALLLAILCLRLIRTKFYIIGYAIGVLWLASMQMQSINAIRSWELRQDRLKDYVSILNQEKKENQYFFIQAPYFLSSNYNNEHVFALNDDFQGGLLLHGFKGNHQQVYPFCSKMLGDGSYFSNHNIYKVIKENKLSTFDVWLTDGRLKRNQTLKSLNHLSLSSQRECWRSIMRSYFIRQMEVLR